MSYYLSFSVLKRPNFLPNIQPVPDIPMFPMLSARLAVTVPVTLAMVTGGASEAVTSSSRLPTPGTSCPRLLGSLQSSCLQCFVACHNSSISRDNIDLKGLTHSISLSPEQWPDKMPSCTGQ